MTEQDILNYSNLHTRLRRACRLYFDRFIKNGNEYMRFLDCSIYNQYNPIIKYTDGYDVHEIEIDRDDFLKFIETL